MSTGSSAQDHLIKLGEKIREEFSQNRRVMSFAEYLALVLEKPRIQLRSAPQYVRDAFDHFGTESIHYPWGVMRRFKLFDCPWADGRDMLIGQETVQNRIYRALENFVHEGTSNKLILLHGPNGSAKSTLVRCIGRALQHYSDLEEGALYRFNWIFPAEKLSKGGIGFSGAGIQDRTHTETFAYLPDELIDSKLPDEMRDHPLFLLPPDDRAGLMARALAGGEDQGEFVLSDYLRFGQLSHKNRTIYEALLSSYQGDYLKVLRHVQVERFYIRHRYRRGFATVEPQLSVDATEHQVTMDRSVSALPAALQAISLFEYGGELVCANRGLIEYSDLLKRPLEAYKYLLSTVEDASIGLANANLFFDLVFIGTSNEIHLSAFKQIPEFQSFKGRLELVRVPYLVDYLQEERIYQQRIGEAAGTRHVAPHCAYIAALWAVLTRMRKPEPARYSDEISEMVGQLTPLDKAELYALGRAPDSLPSDNAKALVAHIGDLWRETEAHSEYEGRGGASPRELLTVLFNAANSASFSYVSPVAILEEIEELIKQTSVYQFLKQEPAPGGYHAFAKFIEQVKERLLDRIDDDVRNSLGLVEETEYGRVFQRYVTHVVSWTKKEKVVNPTTGRYEDPDETMMQEVEKTIGATGKTEDYRSDLIAKIGAWSLDHREQKPDYTQIFADSFKRLRDAYFARQKKTVSRGVEELITLLTDGEAALSSKESRARAKRALEQLGSRFGYQEDSARDLIRLLFRNRYANRD